MSQVQDEHEKSEKGEDIFKGGAAECYAAVAKRMTTPAGEEIVRLAQGSYAIASPDAEILDVGCGTGVIPSIIRKHSSSPVTAIDFSPDMLDKLKAKDLPNVRVLQGDATNLKASGIADDSFTHVFSAFMLQFVPDPPAALQEMFRVLKPGGILAASTWAPLDNQTWTRAVRKYADPNYTIPMGFNFGTYPTSPEGVQDLFEQIGFKNVKAKVFFTSFGFQNHKDMLSFMCDSAHPMPERIVKPWKKTEHWTKLRAGFETMLKEEFPEPQMMGTDSVLCVASKE